MQEVIKVAFLGIAGVLLATQFKTAKPEFSILISLGICLLLFRFGVRQMEALLSQIEKINLFLGEGQAYLRVLLKVVGITYICEFGAGICKDAGYQAMAGQIEVLGKLSVFFTGLPILFAVIEQIQQFM
jgi:stage III sporulation protein AD